MANERPAAANHVRQHRLAAGLSQQALADACAVTRQAIHAIETGRYVPNTLVALYLAQALGCSVEALFTLTDTPARVLAELPAGAVPDRETQRVQVARVGRRTLAYPLEGSVGAMAAADGLTAAPPLRSVHPGDPPAPADGARSTAVDLFVDPAVIPQTVVVCGCDPALSLLGTHFARRYPLYRLIWRPLSSLAALRALARGETHIAGTHLPDPQSGGSNLHSIARELPDQPVAVVAFADWQQGLLLASGNPKAIATPADLAREGVRIVNREAGAGSRLLLDSWLRRGGVPASAVAGYRHEVDGHFAVGAAIAAGAADAGPGILSVARILGLDFLPLHAQRFDLVIPRPYLDTPAVQALLDVALTASYRRELSALGGYDSRCAGQLTTIGATG